MDKNIEVPVATEGAPPNERISAKFFKCPKCGHRTSVEFGACKGCRPQFSRREEPGPDMDLSEEDWVFVRAILHGMGKSPACLKAYGGDPNTSNRRGWQRYHHPRIQKVLKDISAEVKESLKISTERILRERACLAFSDLTRIEAALEDGDVSVLSPEDSAAIESVVVQHTKAKDGKPIRTVRVKLYDKNAALTALEKINGMYEADNKQKVPVLPVLSITVDPDPGANNGG
jgi:hypothetical protein